MYGDAKIEALKLSDSEDLMKLAEATVSSL